jgi:hypothetical protein
VIRQTGWLVFLTNSIFYALTTPDLEETGPPGNRLLRAYQGMHTIVWSDTPEETEFHLPHGKWIELLTNHGFQINALHELSAIPDSAGDYGSVTKEWAECYPSEEVWVCTKR